LYPGLTRLQHIDVVGCRHIASPEDTRNNAWIITVLSALYVWAMPRPSLCRGKPALAIDITYLFKLWNVQANNFSACLLYPCKSTFKRCQHMLISIFQDYLVRYA